MEKFLGPTKTFVIAKYVKSKAALINLQKWRSTLDVLRRII